MRRYRIPYVVTELDAPLPNTIRRYGIRCADTEFDAPLQNSMRRYRTRYAISEFHLSGRSLSHFFESLWFTIRFLLTKAAAP